MYNGAIINQLDTITASLNQLGLGIVEKDGNFFVYPLGKAVEELQPKRSLKIDVTKITDSALLAAAGLSIKGDKITVVGATAKTLLKISFKPAKKPVVKPGKSAVEGSEDVSEDDEE